VDVNQSYELCQYCVAKNSAQGYLSPQDFNHIINVAQRSYIDYLIGQYQQYQVKRPIPIVAFGENERIRTSLAPLIYEEIIPVNSSTGIGAFPYGFIQVDAMWGQYGYYNIRFTEQDRLSSNLNSVIDRQTTNNAIYLIRHEGFKFFPESIGNVRCSYVQNPPSISWGYTEVNGVPVWNPATSSNPVWDDIDMMNIIVRALSIVGVNLQLGVVMQYSNDIKKGGQ
jgi:hypothetical protein